MKHLFTIALALLLAGLQAQTGITVVADCVCEGNPRQAFDVTAEGTAGPFQFLWSGPEGYTSWEQNPTDIELPGQYTLKIANFYGCVFEYKASVESCAGPGFEFEVVPAAPSCPGGIVASLTGPEAYGSYQWYGEAGALAGQNSLELSGAVAGAYRLAVVGESGCAFLSEWVEVPAIPGLSLAVAGQSPSCGGAATGSITVSASGGTPPYSYAWSNGAASEGGLDGLAAGLYGLTVTDAMGCERALNFSIGQEQPPTVAATAVPPTCPAVADGSIALDIEGLLPTVYEVAWSTGASGLVLSGLAAGAYSATVTSEHGCAYPVGPWALEAGELFELQLAGSPVSCSGGQPDGALSASAVGQGPFSYNWAKEGDPSFQAQGSSLSGLDIGTYCVTVTDQVSGCENVACEELQGTPWPYLRAVEVKASGPGIAAVIYYAEWAPDANGRLILQGGNTPAFTPNVVGMMEDGLIALSITAWASQPLSGLAIAYPGTAIPSTPLFEEDIQYTFAVQATDVPLMIANGAIAQPLRFIGLDTGGRLLMSMVPPSGRLGVPLPEQGPGCTWSPAPQYTPDGADEVHILEQGCMTVEFSVNPGGGQVAIAQIVGGSGPYTVYWIDLPPGALVSPSGFIVTKLEGGREYCARVVDSQGCTVIACTYLCHDIADGYSVDIELPCPNQPLSGTICLSLFQEGLTVEWGNPEPGLCWQGLSQPEVYSIELADLVCGQELSIAVPLEGTLPFLEVAATGGSPACHSSQADGSLTVAAQGGRPPYAYIWESGAAGSTATGLAPGVCHALTVTDGCGQVWEGCFELPAYVPMEVEALHVKKPCFNSYNGYAVAELTGGRPPYTFVWESLDDPLFNGGQGPVTTSSPQLGGLGEGEYTLSVQDGCGRNLSYTFTVEGDAPPELLAAPPAITRACAGSANGSIELDLAPQYATDADFLWSNGSETASITGLQSGWYYLTVSLPDGCTLTEQYFVPSFDPLISLSAMTACGAGSNGSINFSFELQTNTPFRSYQAVWNNGVVWDFGLASYSQPYENTLQGLAPGLYKVEVLNEFGCPAMAEIEVGQAPVLQIVLADFQAETIDPLSGAGLQDGFLLIEVLGGSGDYTIDWDNGAASTLLYEGLSEGVSYTVAVTDNQSGCTAVESYLLETCPPYTITITDPYHPYLPPRIVPASNGSNGAIEVTVQTSSNGQTVLIPLYFSWTGPDGFSSSQQNISGLVPGTYCVTVANDCGQQVQACYEIIRDCPEWAVNLSTNNRCVDNSNPKRLILDDFRSRPFGVGNNGLYDVGDRFYVTWTKDGGDLDDPPKRSAFVITGLATGGSGYDAIQWVHNNNNHRVSGNGRYYCTVTDKYGCSKTYWADFDNEKMLGRAMSSLSFRSDVSSWGLDFGWRLRESHFSEVVADPAFYSQEEYEAFISQNGVGNLSSCWYCGFTYDNPSGTGYVLRPETCYSGDVYKTFCFIPEGGAESEAGNGGNVCQLGGQIYAPGYGWFDVLSGYGRKMEWRDKCGCTFPPEAFVGRMPVVYDYTAGGLVPIHLIPDVAFIYANCPSSCPEEEPPSTTGDEASVKRCLYQDEETGFCFEVSYLDVSGGSGPWAVDCEIVGVEPLLPAACQASNLEKCEGCPAETLKPFWCEDNVHGTIACRVGFFQDLNSNSIMDPGEEILFLIDLPEAQSGICGQLRAANVPPSNALCAGGSCVPIAGTLQHDADCEYEDCGCSIEVLCGDEGRTTVQGRIVEEFVSGQSPAYACPELCYDGHFCMRSIRCDFSASSRPELGVRELKKALSMATKLVLDGGSACEVCIPESPVPGGSPCMVRYFCGGEEVASFCHPDNNSIGQLYACAGTPTTCNGFTPLVIESRSTSTGPEGEEIEELSFAIVPDSSFRVSSVHPNPFQEELTIRLTASYAGEAQIKMVNLLGQPALLEARAFIRGYTPIVLDTRSARLLPGLYVLIVTDGRGGRFTEKVIYQR